MARPRLSVVVSTPRVGSSWTARLLSANDDLAVMTHDAADSYLMYALFPATSLNPWSDDQHSRGRMDPLRARLLGTWSRRRGGDSRMPVIASPTVALCLGLLEDAFDVSYVSLTRDPVATVRSLRTFLRRRGEATYSQRAHAMSGDRLGGRTPRAYLAHGFHRLRWAGLGRDGYIGLRPPGGREVRYLSELEFVCWYYVALNEMIDRHLDGIAPDRQLAVTYEELGHDPAGVLSRVVPFVGGRVTDAYLDGIGSLLRDEPPRPTDHREPEAQQILELIAHRRGALPGRGPAA